MSGIVVPAAESGGSHGRVVIGHLFPEALNLYGDRGNIVTLVQRAVWRGIGAEVRGIGAGDAAALEGVDVIFMGGGADQHQQSIADALMELVDPLRRAIDDGAVLLTVCAGFQSLGHAFRSPHVGVIPGPGLLDVETEMPAGAERFVGGIEVELDPASPIAIGGASGHRRLVGFENHSGRTTLGPTMRPLGRVVFGRGNDGASGFEGAIALPGEGGLRGLRIGTYMHGPLLPRNPHLADFVLASGLGRGRPVDLAPLDDAFEWDAHDRFAADWTAIRPGVYRRSRVGRLRDRMGALIGF